MSSQQIASLSHGRADALLLHEALIGQARQPVNFLTS